MAEIEFSVLSRQCLDRRIGTQKELVREVTAWVNARNANGATVHWQFTTADARIKLKRLYPVWEIPSAAPSLASISPARKQASKLVPYEPAKRKRKASRTAAVSVAPTT